MDDAYLDTVRLLLAIAPDVFRSDVFAMKGGTAINLFVRSLPRLSVDIDVVFLPWNLERQDALHAIGAELDGIRERLGRLGLDITSVASTGEATRTLLVRDDSTMVKIEVNTIFRGTILPVRMNSLAIAAAERFQVDLRVPVLHVDELYGSKLVAAMDRQHPRDLFDVLQLEDSDGITDGMIECFVMYLAGHNRPTHEVLGGTAKDLTLEYSSTFRGMTAAEVGLDALVDVQRRLLRDMPSRLRPRHRDFLATLMQARPDWSLVTCPHAANLPAIQWKLKNLRKLQQTNPVKFELQAKLLADVLQ